MAPARVDRGASFAAHRGARVMAVDTVAASHVLVKHARSRRPASWRDPDGATIAKKVRATRVDADGTDADADDARRARAPTTRGDGRDRARGD